MPGLATQRAGMACTPAPLGLGLGCSVEEASMAAPYSGRPLAKSRLCPKSCIKIVALCFVSGMRNLFEPERFFLDHMIPGISKKVL